MRFHIIGADGYIGTKIRQYLPQEIKPICYDTQEKEEIRPIDLTKAEAFDFSQVRKGDFILFLAAISRPDLCKNQKEMAYRVNVEGTARFLQCFSEIGAHTLFFSSDTVYGETTMQKVNELSPCVPFGPYAEMKHEIEVRFADDLNIKIFRLSYVFSKEDRFTSYLAKCAKENTEAGVFESFYRSVVYINDIFDAVIALSERFDQFSNSIFNLSGPEVLSRKDIAQLYRETINPELQFRAVDPPEDFFDARPPIIATESLYLEKLLNRKATNIREALQQENKNERRTKQ